MKHCILRSVSWWLLTRKEKRVSCAGIFWRPLRFWDRALLDRDAFAPAVKPRRCPGAWCANFNQICSHNSSLGMHISRMCTILPCLH